MGFKGSKRSKEYLLSVLFNLITISMARQISIYFFNLKDENSYWFSTRLQTTIPFTIFIVLLINIFYVVLYFGKFDYFEKMKITPEKWPWEENAQRFKQRLPKMIVYYLINLLLVGIPFAMFVNRIYTPKGRNEEKEMPSLLEIYICLFICSFLEDFVFYFSHRFLHHPQMYKYIHKIHHENSQLIHINCVYTHPIETVLGNFVPLYFSLFVLGQHIHFVTFYTWMIYRFIETHEAHSGYEFKYSIFDANPFNIDGDYHNFHHYKNSGNYATFFKFWDQFFGTNIAYKNRNKLQLFLINLNQNEIIIHILNNLKELFI